MKMLGVMDPLPRRIAGLLLLLLAGCSATGYRISDLAAEINATLQREPVGVEVGDTLLVRFPFKPEWNQKVRVRPDGFGSFLLLDDVAVVGLTLAELDKKLTDLLAQRGNPQEVSVDIETPSGEGGSERASGRFSAFVVGEVERPGVVELLGRTYTLAEAISAAGGHKKATANLGNTILVRRLASGEMRQWRLDADIYEWGLQPPIYLQPRDIVFVPNTAIDEVNIWVDQYIRQMIPLPGFTPIP